MWTRGLRTRSSLSWMLALLAMRNYLRLMVKDGSIRPTIRQLVLPVRGCGGFDAHLFEQNLARGVLGNQLGEKIREGGAGPADHLFQGVGDDRMRLGPLEVRGDLQQVAEGVVAAAEAVGCFAGPGGASRGGPRRAVGS